MTNIEIEVSPDGKKATITFQLDKDYGQSKTGKSHIVASTGGFVLVTGGIKVNVAAIK